ncbi:LOW QUALITY PROTEIN: uncharacterized protein K02A2.6-like [Cololabis saira]|uniref:LOW QUALITY PROTEIN: uncharacterized protein K02A2.6-like n=1 Tax=Cololabis saira TaxID=129043 RepID=UPI002AD55158|nr:LOW QUALITY PROTEIN: uncharacterized protein K02A2.6-like [Cololabis saira]
MLRDRLVCGVNDDSIQRKLLSHRELDFKKAWEIAQSMETADKDVRDIQALWREEAGAAGRAKPGEAVYQVSEQRAHVSPAPGPQCFRCKGRHSPFDCRFAAETCHGCGKKGHLIRACRSKGKPTPGQSGPQGKAVGGRSRRAHLLRDGGSSSSESEQDMSSMHALCMVGQNNQKVPPILQSVFINGTEVHFEVDTGCSVTIVSQKQYVKLRNLAIMPKLDTCPIKLKTYTGERLQVKGMARVTVTHQNVSRELPVIVVAGSGPNLLGRSWLQALAMEVHSLHQVESAPNNPPKPGSTRLEEVLMKHDAVFKDELGTLKGIKATIHVDAEAKPKFFKPRSVPYAVRPLVEAELDRLLEDKIIEPVTHSEWAAPIVPILKPVGGVRICGDYKVTVNRASSVEQYPIPRVEDLFAKLSGGEQFSKLDMSHAYLQVVLDESSQQYVTINTHRGLYTYKRLPFGVSSSPAIFQRIMEGILRGIPHCSVFLDDILLSGPTETEHLKTLEEVLQRIEDHGLRLKRQKCSFLQNEVMYLGHMIDRNGLRPVTEKMAAIKDAPTPKTVSELKSYLGLLNYYHRFLPNLSSLLSPLHSLLRKDVRWSWGPTQQEAFEMSKTLLQSSQVLVHYDTKKEVVLACDASPYGVGAVLSHRMPDGSERPVGFVSRTLTAAERNYSQLDKEGLAVMFGVKKFHNYVYGRNFTIVTDHKPLLSLFSEARMVPQMVSPRVQRWAVTLGAYNYVMVYKAGKDHGNADAFSRLPVSSGEEEGADPEDGGTVMMIEHLDTPLVTDRQVERWTSRDPVLARVLEYVGRGWPSGVINPCFAPYYQRRDELSIQGGCVLWGARVVIPTRGRPAVLQQLHQSHPGITRMKGLARSYVWWPQLDADVEGLVRGCNICQVNRKMPTHAPLHPWEWPAKRWRRIHIDYAGPFMGRMFLVIIDAHSKWIEAYPLHSSTTAATIECLRDCFSRFGLPEMVVSDNATCYTSRDFQEFMVRNGIQHVTTAPWHPASNGLAERAVQTLKSLLKKSSGGSVETKLSRALFSYRITPQSTTGKSPAELMMNGKLRSTLDLLHPDLQSRVQHKQWKQKEQHDQHARARSLQEGAPVYTKNFSAGPSWIPGMVESVTGPVSCTVLLGSGQRVRRHVDHVRHRSPPPSPTLPRADASMEFPQVPCPSSSPPMDITTDPSGYEQSTNVECSPPDPPAATPPAPPVLRRSGRESRPPDRYVP